MMAMPIMSVSSIKTVTTRKTKDGSSVRERTVLYEGSSSPRELLEGIALQAQAALKGLEGTKPAEEVPKELTEEQKRMAADSKGKSKESAVLEGSEENQKLFGFCNRILATASCIDKSLREAKGDAFMDRLRSQFQSIFTGSSSATAAVLGPDASDVSGKAPQPPLVDPVDLTITACRSNTTPVAVSVQIVMALVSLVLSPDMLIHHSSLLKAVRTVYNVFLLSNDPVNQMVAQGGLTQMVHHVFTRCKAPSIESKTPIDGEYPNGDHRNGSFSPPTPDSVNGPRPQSHSGSASESTASLNLPSAEEDQARTPQTAVTL
jgi:hypothetical protein